jgi:hypothetical protein
LSAISADLGGNSGSVLDAVGRTDQVVLALASAGQASAALRPMLPCAQHPSQIEARSLHGDERPS